MSLKGNTRTMPLADLLTFLGSRASTGTLELQRDTSWKRLYLEKGSIIASGSSEPTEYLGHFLISEKKITEEKLTEALEVQKKTKVMLGKILVMIGAVTEEELRDMLERKCRESVVSMFLWDEAEFEFFDNQLPAVRMIPTSMSVEPLVSEGTARRQEWKSLRQAYPSSDIRFAKDPSAVLTPYVDPFEMTIFQLIDGKRSIADLTIETHGTDYRIIHALDQLRKRGWIGIANYGNVNKVAERPNLPLEQMLEMSRNKLAFARWEEAINLLKYIQQNYPQNGEAKELMIRAEAGLVQSIYEEAVAPDAVLQLALPVEALAKEKLSSEESFMVTRINGRWDLKSILTITPLREVDALRIVKRLLDRHLIRV